MHHWEKQQSVSDRISTSASMNKLNREMIRQDKSLSRLFTIYTGMSLDFVPPKLHQQALRGKAINPFATATHLKSTSEHDLFIVKS